MWNNTRISKKTKTFLSVATAIITSTAVTTVLTSCSVGNQNIIDDIGGWDATYGINDATYKRMEEDFKTLYKSQLDENKKLGKIDDITYNLDLSTFQNNLNFIHASLYSDENKTLSYTIKTNVLRDYARNNYGIRLSRQSNVSLSVAISGIKGSIINSVLLLCKEYKIADADINKYRENAEAEFEKLYTEAKSKYAEDDVVSIVQHIQSGMVSCFANINKELDVLITQQQLKDFISKYQISVREDIAESYYWDKLNLIYSEQNQEISAEDFNNIFEITYEDSDPQSSNGSYFSSSKKTVEFKNDMITGYTLKPILAKMNGDPYTNVYSIDVDYTLVNNNYKDDEKVAELIAHSSQLKDKSFYENENISIFDLNKSSEEREYTNYILPITKRYEEEQINKAYFNNQDFKFTWSTSEEYGYDDFWTESNEKGGYKSKLNVSSLATSGMMINGFLLSDILYQAEKISLSGGSVSLSGKAKTKGEDSKQWKLTINGEVVDKNAIEWKLISPTNKKLPDTIFINDGIVSWTDQIETGAYNFYVLAICKETKIQTPLITLTISSEQLGSVESFDHNVKNSLYDESTIDQKLIDFVNNVNFSLDYTENDYDTEREDHKKGGIKINGFNIGYKNSKNIFEASNSINDDISNAINNDSGITRHFSNNLYENVKSNFLMVLIEPSVYGQCIKEYVKTTSDSLNDKWISMLMVSSVCTGIAIACLGIIIYNALSNKKSSLSSLKKYLSWAVVVFSFCTLIIMTILAGTNVACNIGNKLDKLEKFNNWDKHVDDGDEFYTKICDDIMYFLPNDGSEEAAEKCKEKFNNLSVSDAKAKKSFYEQCFIKPDDYDTNLKKYADTPYGQRQKSLDNINQALKDMQDIVANFALFMLGCLICAGLLLVSLFIIIKSFSKKNNDDGILNEINENADKLKKEGKDNKTWSDLDDKTRTEFQQKVINKNIFGKDIQFNERKPIFDKAINEKNLIFVNTSVEDIHNLTEYELLLEHIDGTNFNFYRKRSFNFIEKIIELL